MNLRNPFTTETRLLFLGVWVCWQCGGNGTQAGGLELHHIMGRISASPFNAAILCHNCHEKVLHTQEVESVLFLKTLVFLKSIKYRMTSEDMYFLEDNKNRLLTPEVNRAIEKL